MQFSTFSANFVSLAAPSLDEVKDVIARALQPFVDNLTLEADEAGNVAGTTSDDLIVGDDRDNSLDGNLGFDTVILRGTSYGDYEIVNNIDGTTTVTDLNLDDGNEGRDELTSVEDIKISIAGTDQDDVIMTTDPDVLGLKGGGGSDTYVVTQGNQVIFEEEGDGEDTVKTEFSRRLEDNVENLILTGENDLVAVGNKLDNLIVGNSGANELTTGLGAIDTLEGGGGHDVYYVDKLSGVAVIDDIPGESNTLDLTEFFGGSGNFELSIRRQEESDVGPDEFTGGTGGTTLLIENSSGGVIHVLGYFDDEGTTVSEVRVGEDSFDISAETDFVDLGESIAASKRADSIDFIDPDEDGHLWNAAIIVDDEQTISAAEAQVVRAYLAGLGRLPGENGFDFWLDKITQGAPLVNVAKGFVSAPEFIAKADSDDDSELSNDEFLTHMYVNVFQREPDNDGYVWWLGQLDGDFKSQDLALVEMTQSNEYVVSTMSSVVDYLVG